MTRSGKNLYDPEAILAVQRRRTQKDGFAAGGFMRAAPEQWRTLATCFVGRGSSFPEQDRRLSALWREMTPPSAPVRSAVLREEPHAWRMPRSHSSFLTASSRNMTGISSRTGYTSPQAGHSRPASLSTGASAPLQTGQASRSF